MSIQSNQVYEFASDRSRIRVLGVDPDRRIAAVIPMSKPLAKLGPAPLDRLNHDLSIGKLIPVLYSDPAEPDAFLDERKVAYRERMMKVIRRIVERPVIDLASNGYWPDIEKAARAANLSHNCVYAAITRYFQGGATEAALNPRWSSRGKSTKPGVHSRGLAVVVRKKIQTAVDAFYKGDATWENAHKDFLERDYCSHIEINPDGVEVRRTKPPNECPSLWQFYRIGRAHLKTIGKLVQKLGRRGYEITGRGKPGSQAAAALYPGYTAEIDWTITDSVAVRRWNRASIGRLVVYAIVDPYSGEILAILLTIFAGSWEEAAKSIIICLEDKVEVCARVGITIKPEDWPVQHLFWRLVSDKGEVDSWKSTPIATGLGIEIQHVVGRRPDQKGTIEAVMKVINYLLYRRIPGATTGMRQRCTDDPRVTAVYDFDQLNALLHAFAIWHNKRLRKRQPLTPGMVADGVRRVPNQIWQWAESNGLLRRFDLAEAKAQLMPWHEASVTEHGFVLEGLTFLIPEVDPGTPGGIDANEWLAKARQKRWRVRLAVDLSTVAYVYIRLQLAGQKARLIKCSLSPVHAAFAGYSWEDWRKWRASQKEMEKAYRDGALLHATQDFRAVLRAINENAMAQTAAARVGLSKAAQTRGIDHNRAAETAEMHRDNGAKFRGSSAVPALRSYFDEELWPTADCCDKSAEGSIHGR